MADHGGEQSGGLAQGGAELFALEDHEAGVGVLGPTVDEGVTGGGVVPVDLGLGRAGVVVPARHGLAHVGCQFVVGHLEQAPDGRADERDGVHGGHRVIERGRVEDALASDEPGLFGGVTGDVEDPVGMFGAPQALAHVDEDGVGEARPSLGVVAADAGRVAPAVVEAVALDRLAVREAFKALEHHDHGDDRGRHRASALVVEEIAEGLVGEEPIALAVQEGIDRVRFERLVAEPGHVVEQVALLVRHTERHGSLRGRELQRCNSPRS